VLSNSSFAQNIDETKSYIYTKEDKLIYGKKIVYKTPFLATNYFLVDTIKHKPTDVKFYKNSKGFFANVSYQVGLGPTGFAERVSKGKLNLYKKEVSMYNPGHMGPHGMMMGGGFSQNTIQYYNRGFEELKKAKYKYLVKDLADNANSMKLLGKYKKNRNIATGLYIAGAAVGITGLVGFIKKTSNTAGKPEQDTSVNTTLMISGVGTMLVGSIFSFSLNKKVEDAIDAYNE